MKPFILKCSVFLLISLISTCKSVRGDNIFKNSPRNHEQVRADMLKDFRPSRLISETRNGPEISPSLSSNINPLLDKLNLNTNPGPKISNLQVSQKSTSNPSEIGSKAESSEMQGRLFFGGGGGGGFSKGWSSWGQGGHGGHQCQTLHSYNPGCCNLGFKNCCNNPGGWGGGGGGIQFPPIRHPPGNSWGKGQVQPHFPPIHHQHQPHQHQAHQHHHHPGFLKPRPSRPHLHAFPVVNNVQKPGSCFFNSPSVSIFDKFSNLFSKGKILDVHNHHHHGDHTKGFKGWGWNSYPPSQNAGYHFHRRSDILSKRQLDLSYPNDQNNNYKHYDQQQDYFQTNNNNNNKNNFGLSKANNPQLNSGAFDSPDNYRLQPNDNDHNREDKKLFEASYPQQSYSHVPQPAGIGSLTGRIFGGLGWDNGITTGWTVADPNIPCHTDYECPGNRKCCGWVCKTPSFSG